MAKWPQDFEVVGQAMTTSDSRVTDEMVNAALKAHYKHSYKTLFTGVHGIPDHSGAMRLAIEAAISHQAPVVAVSDADIAHLVEEVAKVLSGAPFPSAKSYAKAREVADLISKAERDE